MFKQRMIRVVAGLALLVAGIGASGVVIDALGYSGTLPAHACNSAGSSGGGC
jgi:hypothetical protein